MPAVLALYGSRRDVGCSWAGMSGSPAAGVRNSLSQLRCVRSVVFDEHEEPGCFLGALGLQCMHWVAIPCLHSYLCFSSGAFHLTLPVQCLPVGSADSQPRLLLPPGHFVKFALSYYWER